MAYFLSLLSALFSLPIFFDLYYMEMIDSSEPFGHKTQIPIPIGFFSFIIVFSFFFLFRLLGKVECYSFSSRKESLLLFALCVYFFYHGYFFSELSLLRIAQLLMPFIFFLLVSLPKSAQQRKQFFDVAIYSFMAFVTLHFISLLLSNDSLFEVGSLEFPMFFGHSIYQSLVSYPAVLSLYLTVMIYIIFNHSNSAFYKLIVIVLGYLVLTTARKAVLFELFLLLFLNLIMLPFFLRLKMTHQMWLRELGLIFTGLICVAFLLYQTPALDRLILSFEQSTFTGGRVDIFSQAINIISSDVLRFLVGFGGGEYSFHNFVIDLVFRLGLIVSLLYIFSLSLIFKKIVVLVKKTDEPVRGWFLFTVFGQFIIQVMTNSPLTQPYYLVNFCFVLMFFVYYPVGNEKAVS